MSDSFVLNEHEPCLSKPQDPTADEQEQAVQCLLLTHFSKGKGITAYLPAAGLASLNSYQGGADVYVVSDPQTRAQLRGVLQSQRESGTESAAKPQDPTVDELMAQIWDLRNHLAGISILGDAGHMAAIAKQALSRNSEPGRKRRRS